MSWRASTLGVALILLTAGAVAAEEPSKWEFEFAPYVWVPGTFGTVNVKGRTAIVDTTVKDSLDLATGGNAFVAAGYFSASYDRWSAFFDAFGGYLEESAVEKVPTRFCTLCIAGKADLRPVFVDFAVGYRVGQWSLAGRRRPVTLGVYAGTRYMHFGAHLSASAGVVGAATRSAEVSTAFNWADPMIGLRWEVPLLDRLSLDFRSDIGGFGASSKLIWGVVGGVRYWVPWTPSSVQPWLGAGYRVVTFDRDFGAEGNLDLQFRGPMGGVGFVF
jgi:hypothetical protein